MAFALSSLAFRRPSFLPLPSSVHARQPIARTTSRKFRRNGAAAQDPAMLRRPLVSAPSPAEGRSAPYASSSGEDEDGGQEDGVSVSVAGASEESGMRRAEQEFGVRGKRRSRRDRSRDEDWVDWEDLILEDTVPLVGFVRMILHSGKYEIGDRLIPEHETMIMEKLLPYHPESEKKIGCGVDYITIGLHPEFENSRCLFIVRKDGEAVDFSFWKCIKGLIRKKYPLYADTFILRNFRRRRYNE